MINELHYFYLLEIIAMSFYYSLNYTKIANKITSILQVFKVTNRPKADIALIGLAVMGQNLILNMDSKGFVVCAFNRTVAKVDEFLKNEAKGTKIIGATSLEDMVAKLKKPRKVMLLVKAGSAVDEFVRKLVPLLEKGDIIIDGGNSQYIDTQRWCKELASTGILFIGMGVSGGEDGARYGPSLMPGGHPAAWPHVKPIFQAICAKANNEPCCDWVGEDGAGHFVKMVHNGIEYGDMQLICEAYNLMKDVLGMEQGEMAQVFEEWNKGDLDSFLIEISRDILKYKDSDGKYLLPKIRDTAGQKGTGKWTGIAALEYGVPVTLIGEAVFARCLSALKDERVKASKVNQWNLNYGSIALMWRGGCIIRSAFLGNIKDAFTKNPQLTNLLLDPFFCDRISGSQQSLRQVVAQTALAQRDYFGAHTYELITKPGEFVHTNWTGHGGNVSASTYNN
ncbi:hypothetical protein B5X24_HaOG213360 [Helicoverpa armigera]|uniref:6-phosphogluconate dehydrogenase, decarboxylating n=1 Tax=Helicoverpa armigera TaxID=29058 RepID=A0A2W1BCB3_HELAM|nr:hypothetical protein B5X24_HaOG213360 [Helicoverpa armigera]